MTPEEREKFYDDEVAPVLLDLARKCHANGISFVADVEWEPGESGTTTLLAEPHSFSIEMSAICARANNNADAMIMHMMRYARERGHSSICLGQLGVPYTPSPAQQTPNPST